MGRNEVRRQKKLMKKRQKDKVRRREHAVVAAPNSKQLILAAREFPLHECLINRGGTDMGLVRILLSRKQPNGDIVWAVFLVDLMCLGVKDAFCNANFSPYLYRTKVADGVFEERPEPCPPERAHQIIYGAIAYARQFGFEPHHDFALAQHLLDPPDRYEPTDDIPFGRDGKPFFVPGPYDDVEKILRKLEATAGAGNYDYLAHL
jgi:hypothetical protein